MKIVMSRDDLTGYKFSCDCQDFLRRSGYTPTEEDIQSRLERAWSLDVRKANAVKYVVSGGSRPHDVLIAETRKWERGPHWYCKHVLAVLLELTGGYDFMMDADYIDNDSKTERVNIDGWLVALAERS